MSPRDWRHCHHGSQYSCVSQGPHLQAPSSSETCDPSVSWEVWNNILSWCWNWPSPRVPEWEAELWNLRSQLGHLQLWGGAVEKWAVTRRSDRWSLSCKQWSRGPSPCLWGGQPILPTCTWWGLVRHRPAGPASKHSDVNRSSLVSQGVGRSWGFTFLFGMWVSWEAYKTKGRPRTMGMVVTQTEKPQRVAHRLQRPRGWGTKVSPLLLWDVERGWVQMHIGKLCRWQS